MADANGRGRGTWMARAMEEGRRARRAGGRDQMKDKRIEEEACVAGDVLRDLKHKQERLSRQGVASGDGIGRRKVAVNVGGETPQVARGGNWRGWEILAKSKQETVQGTVRAAESSEGTDRAGGCCCDVRVAMLIFGKGSNERLHRILVIHRAVGEIERRRRSSGGGDCTAERRAAWRRTSRQHEPDRCSQQPTEGEDRDGDPAARLSLWFGGGAGKQPDETRAGLRERPFRTLFCPRSPFSRFSFGTRALSASASAH
eukprot:5830143-Pleurochrysis_carterae.AAC.1